MYCTESSGTLLIILPVWSVLERWFKSLVNLTPPVAFGEDILASCVEDAAAAAAEQDPKWAVLAEEDVAEEEVVDDREVVANW